MSIKNKDMPAMPNSNTETYPIPCPVEWGYGLTKRETVLMEFMKAMLSNPEMDYGYKNGAKSLAEDAMGYVSAYFEELEK